MLFFIINYFNYYINSTYLYISSQDINRRSLYENINLKYEKSYLPPSLYPWELYLNLNKYSCTAIEELVVVYLSFLLNPKEVVATIRLIKELPTTNLSPRNSIDTITIELFLSENNISKSIISSYIELGLFLPVRFRTIKNFYTLSSKEDISIRKDDLKMYLFIDRLEEVFKSLKMNRVYRELDRISLLLSNKP
jgi:hypothetical protein